MYPAELPSMALRRTVLLVEDKILVRGTTAEFLRDLGFLVIEAANATEATAVLASRVPVDIVFTDWQKPLGMDGVALARWIGQHHPQVEVLLASGHAYDHGWAAVIPRESFFSKPYDLDKVAARILAVLKS
jgi:DNA-binding NtrC family response regulator